MKVETLINTDVRGNILKYLKLTATYTIQIKGKGDQTETKTEELFINVGDKTYNSVTQMIEHETPISQPTAQSGK